MNVLVSFLRSLWLQSYPGGSIFQIPSRDYVSADERYSRILLSFLLYIYSTLHQEFTGSQEPYRGLLGKSPSHFQLHLSSHDSVVTISNCNLIFLSINYY